MKLFASLLFAFHPGMFLPASGAEPGSDHDAELARAVWQSDIDGVKAALKAGAHPNIPALDKSGPLLHKTLWSGSLEVISALLDAGARADAEDDFGRTALHAAARAYIARGESETGAVQKLRRILATGVDIHHKDHGGEDALAEAAGNHPSLVKVLLEAGAKVSPDAVEQAVQNAVPEGLDLLLKAGGTLDISLAGGRTLMHAACGVPWAREETTAVIATFEKLLAGGLKLDVPDETGMTPLLLASDYGRAAAVEWLLTHGANVRAVDNAGRNALLAAAQGQGEYNNCYDLLIKAGCPLDAVGKARVTALEVLLHRRQWDYAHLLLRRGAAVRKVTAALQDALSAWREAPASAAAMRGIAIRLLRLGPDLSGLRTGERPLLHELVFLGEPSVLKAALKAGAAINARDARGRTALMWAALMEAEPMLAILRTAGAEATLRDHDGKTAADLAAIFQQPPAPPSPAAPARPPADLFDAINAGDAAAAERFLRADQSAAQAERLGLRPIHLTALNDRPDLAELLLKHGADPDALTAEKATPFALAAAAGHAAWCRWFIERASAAQRPALLEEAAAASVKHRHPKLGVELIRLAWKPDAAALGSLLYCAISDNEAAVVRELISLTGGNPPRYTENRDPFAGGHDDDILTWATFHAGAEVMQVLLAATAAKAPEAWRESVNEAFASAIDRNNVPAGRELSRTGLLLEKPPGKTRHPLLQQAVESQATEAAEFLVESGYKVEPGSGLLAAAAEQGNSRLVQLLLQAGALPGETGEEGFNALHRAASLGHEEITAMLLTAGASLQSKTSEGDTAADLAEAQGFLDLADTLRARAAER